MCEVGEDGKNDHTGEMHAAEYALSGAVNPAANPRATQPISTRKTLIRGLTRWVFARCKMAHIAHAK
jgi:hypothetical protein